MDKIHVLDDALAGQSMHSHLEPVLDHLLNTGNALAEGYRWGSNREGYFSLLKYPINFDELEKKFSFPPTIHLIRERGLIYCEKTGCTISAI